MTWSSPQKYLFARCFLSRDGRQWDTPTLRSERELVQLGRNIFLVFTTDDERPSLRFAPGDTESTKERRKTKGQRRKKMFLVPFALHLAPASSVSSVPLWWMYQRIKLQKNFRRRVLG